jgi:hypothetical protein
MDKLMEEVKGIRKTTSEGEWEQKYWGFYIEGFKVIEIERMEKQIERETETIGVEIEGIIQ